MTLRPVVTKHLVTRARRNLPHWQQGGSTYFVSFRVREGRLDTEERRLVLEACLFWHGKKWTVEAVTVMPDHVHLLVRPLTLTCSESFQPLGEIVGSVKRYAANQIHHRRGTRGVFWVEESYDRIVRDQGEFDEKLRYMANNPVRAGLCSDYLEYPFFWYRSMPAPGSAKAPANR